MHMREIVQYQQEVLVLVLLLQQASSKAAIQKRAMVMLI
jgi:hypothetical protein